MKLLVLYVGEEDVRVLVAENGEVVSERVCPDFALGTPWRWRSVERLHALLRDDSTDGTDVAVVLDYGTPERTWAVTVLVEMALGHRCLVLSDEDIWNELEADLHDDPAGVSKLTVFAWLSRVRKAA